MDSELTLVNPSPPIAYFLSSTDLKDTVIFAEPSVPLYRITSDSRQVKIYDSSTPARIIALMHHRDILSDTITFPHRRGKRGMGTMTNVSVQRWLKRTKAGDRQ